MEQKKEIEEMFCRDGAFVLLYTGNLNNWQEIEVLLGLRPDGFYEILGGGFDLRDLTPECAASREMLEESGFEVPIEQLIFFANMVQKLPLLGENEKGYAFYFCRKISTEQRISTKFVASKEHQSLQWHKVIDIFKGGDVLYKTSALRAIVHLLNFLENRRPRFGVLKHKVSFRDNEF